MPTDPVVQLAAPHRGGRGDQRLDRLGDGTRQQVPREQGERDQDQRPGDEGDDDAGGEGVLLLADLLDLGLLAGHGPRQGRYHVAVQ